MIALLLAQASDAATEGFPPGHPLSQISEYWGSGGESQNWEWLLMAVGGVLVVLSAISLRMWWRTRDERPAPLLAFLQVSAAIGLPWPDRFLLWRIARRQRLESPLTLLLCPITLHHHARAYAQAVGLARPGARLRRVASLRRRLFSQG